MAHRAEIVDLIGLHFLDDAYQVGAVSQITVMQDKMPVVDMRILVEPIDPIRIE